MNNPNGVGGQARTANSFVGANTAQSAQQSFVGAAQANATGSSQYGSGMGGMGMGGMGGMGMGGMGGMGMGGMGMGGMGRGNGMGMGGMGMGRNGNNTTTPPVRATVTIGFEPVVSQPEQYSSTISEHLVGLPALHWQVPAQVVMQGRTAVLRGVVATEHDRDLAERVLRLEAGVDRVDNQLVVASHSTAKTAPPAK
jgi:hypothetical protein